MNIVVIALNTLREALRDKILYVLVIFAALMILVSRAVGWVSFGQESKVMTDIGVTATWLFSGMISIFIGTGLIYKEIDKRTIYTVLSKPVERWEFLIGKYFGLVLTTLISLTLLSISFLIYLWLCGAPISLALLQALFLTFIEMMMVTAVAIFFSSASTPILSAIFTTIIFFSGQLTKWVVDLGAIYHFSAPWAEKMLYGLYLVMPNLHNFNIRQQAVLATQSSLGLAIPMEEMWSCTLYGLSYTVALLLLAQLMFRRRNF